MKHRPAFLVFVWSTLAWGSLLDPQQSEIFAKFGKSGLLTWFGAGHEHVVRARSWEGRFDPKKGVFELSVPAEELEVDSPEAMKLAGRNESIDEDDRREVREKMLGASVLGATEFPTLSFTAREISEEELGYQIKGDIEIKGKAKNISFVAKKNGRAIVGMVRLKQSDFGIEPPSVAGVVNVQNEFDLHFNLTRK